ncbi:MAG: DoxX family protein [Planctomycetota bacterium]
MKVLTASLALVGRLALGFPLLWAGWEKLRAFDWWFEKFGQMELVPEASAGVVATAFPGLELVVGLALVLGFWTRAATWLTFGLYALFAAVIAWLLLSGQAAACGCFGPDSDLIVDGAALGLRLIAAAAALALLGLPNSRFSIDALLRVIVPR